MNGVVIAMPVSTDIFTTAPQNSVKSVKIVRPSVFPFRSLAGANNHRKICRWNTRAMPVAVKKNRIVWISRRFNSLKWAENGVFESFMPTHRRAYPDHRPLRASTSDRLPAHLSGLYLQGSAFVPGAF